MPGVQLKSVYHAFGDQVVFNGIDLHLSTESRTALAGVNGSGKTTLMKIVRGDIEPLSGSLTRTGGLRISYLPQTGLQSTDRTLLQEVEKAFFRLKKVEQEKKEVEKTLAFLTENDPEVLPLLEKLDVYQENLTRSGYYDRHRKIEQVLTGLGFSRAQFEMKCDAFSGGWQMRIALAKILLETPDILLLDEPTNYLDLEARNWLEEYLQNYRGGFLVVSHDRYFLDVTVNQVIELFNGNAKLYTGNYTAFEKTRDQELAALVKQYEKQQDEIKKAEDFVRRFRYNASKAALAQSKLKWLEKIEPIQLPETLKKINVSFPSPPHSGKDVLEIENLEKSYPNNRVINGLNFELSRGEKVVLAGPNGAGKSTLLRIIAGIDPRYSGTVTYGRGVKIGYFSCDAAVEQTTESKQIIHVVEEAAPLPLQPKLRDMLGAFLFRGDDVYKPLSVLSGGERSRVSLLLLLLKPVNLLILDEPTNHLDLHSKEMLLTALQNYEGSLLFVSHDRFFIQELAHKVLDLTPGKVKLYPGDYNYYIDRLSREAENLEPGNTVAPEGRGFRAYPSRPSSVPVSSAHLSKTAVSPASPEHNSYHNSGGLKQTGKKSGVAKEQSNSAQKAPESKENAREQRRLENARKNRVRRLQETEADIMKRIEELDEQHTSIQNRMARPEVYESGEQMKELNRELVKNETEKKSLFSQWESITGELSQGAGSQ